VLSLYRRHVKTCSHRGRAYRRCLCPVWYDMRLSGKRIHRPIGTLDWAIAQKRARQIEAEGITGATEPQTIGQACDAFLEDAGARGLRPPSLYKYRLLFRQLQDFAQGRGLTFLSQLGTAELRWFRASWPNKNLSANKKLEHLRAFFRFCQDSGWIKTNPAKAIKSPKIHAPQVLAFSKTEIKRILAACDSHSQPARAVQLQALVLLMLHTGIRIGDAVTLSREAIQKGVLELYTAKSGVRVRIPLNPVVLKALGKIPVDGLSYFWNGESMRTTAVTVWELTFQRMFERAGMKGAHSHQLRHTFCKNLLTAGVSMGHLSLLLGHSSIRITEKYYSAWDKDRQKALDKAVRQTW
jgi:integrase/recombinase XerD